MCKAIDDRWCGLDRVVWVVKTDISAFLKEVHYFRGNPKSAEMVRFEILVWDEKVVITTHTILLIPFF
jgi:hypothetical protein